MGISLRDCQYLFRDFYSQGKELTVEGCSCAVNWPRGMP